MTANRLNRAVGLAHKKTRAVADNYQRDRHLLPFKPF